MTTAESLVQYPQVDQAPSRTPEESAAIVLGRYQQENESSILHNGRIRVPLGLAGIRAARDGDLTLQQLTEAIEYLTPSEEIDDSDTSGDWRQRQMSDH